MKRGRRALAVLLAALAVLLALAFCSERMNTGHEASSRRKSLRIVAFNTHLLPGIALQVAGHRGLAAYRAEAIGRRLADFDVAGLCEVFDSQRRDELIGGAATAAPERFHVAVVSQAARPQFDEQRTAVVESAADRSEPFVDLSRCFTIHLARVSR